MALEKGAIGPGCYWVRECGESGAFFLGQGVEIGRGESAAKGAGIVVLGGNERERQARCSFIWSLSIRMLLYACVLIFSNSLRIQCFFFHWGNKVLE